MKLRIINTVFLILFNLVSMAQENLEEYIPWEANTPLTWADFKADNSNKESILAHANTTYKIEILPIEIQVDEDDNVFNYKELTAIAYFFPKESWVVKPTKELLAHEQLHFDIGEVFARKIRAEFEQLKAKKILGFTDFQKTYTTYWQACEELQHEYDLASQHGFDKENQAAWQTKIENLLIEYKDFSLSE